jgi:hypothetical protein
MSDPYKQVGVTVADPCDISWRYTVDCDVDMNGERPRVSGVVLSYPITEALRHDLGKLDIDTQTWENPERED